MIAIINIFFAFSIRADFVITNKTNTNITILLVMPSTNLPRHLSEQQSVTISECPRFLVFFNKGKSKFGSIDKLDCNSSYDIIEQNAHLQGIKK